MANLQEIIGLTQAQFDTLYENGSVTINGTTLNYSEDILYLVETNEVTGSGGVGSLTDLGVTATAAELNYVDGVTSNIQTQLNGKLPVITQSSYNANTAYDAGLYMVANGSNLPSGSPYGSLLTLPYRKGSGNNSPDFGTQIFIPNGDDATRPNSMFFRTSLSGQWNAWQEVAKKSDIPAAYTLPLAASGTRGGVQIGYGESGANLALKLSSEKGYVTLTKSAVTTALGYTPPTTNTTYSVATASTAGLVKPVSVITKPTLNSVTTTAGKYYQVQMSSDGNMFVNVPWSAGSTSLSSLGITATAAELNYTDGVTSNIQTQLNGKLSATGVYKHDITYSTSLGEGWMSVIDINATAYNDTTFKRKYTGGFFYSVGATTNWDAILVGQIDVTYGEFYGVIAYANGMTYPVMEGMSFTIVSDTVTKL